MAQKTILANVLTHLSSIGISVNCINALDTVGKFIVELNEGERKHIQAIVSTFRSTLSANGYSNFNYTEEITSKALKGTAVGLGIGASVGLAIGGGLGLIVGTALFLCPLTTPVGVLVAGGSGAALLSGGVVAGTGTVVGLSVGDRNKSIRLAIEYS